MRRAVFLDRDGVINVDSGYVYKIQDIKWVEGAIETIKRFNEMNFLVFVVTNQSGVGRNYYSEKDVETLHLWMKDFLEERNALIQDFSYCPHHPNAKLRKYKINCNCRKPNPGLILSIVKKWDININKSFLIGDKESDIEAAKNAGMKGYKFNSQNLLNFTIQNIIL